ncbi:cupin domain-containing protein [Pseudogemmobacter bohemicus]|uniref:cupin domain-containing protein n=1 Tax=Pseudogemmobacter bohemicus TaxID=2250708 RepID=UPI000DD46292|nr:cupin domain-containing protein [Pseudogemmobacter bohemicus]
MSAVSQEIIARLDLKPHPEGGWYRETWRGPIREGRASGTAILFLLQAGERSHWHRVDADEIWLWHAGAPLDLSMGERNARRFTLGPDILGGQQCQLMVPAGWWQAASSTGDWTLVSCTVSPGFRFEGYELAPAGWTLPGDDDGS